MKRYYAASAHLHEVIDGVSPDDWGRRVVLTEDALAAISAAREEGRAEGRAKAEAALKWRPADPPPKDYAEVIAVNAAGEYFIATHFIAGGWAGERVEKSSPVVKWLPIPKEELPKSS